jgi:hypothetical protein
MRRRLLGVMLLCGCAHFGAMTQASEDHDCDRDSIKVLEDGTDTVRLDVCGQERQYRDLSHEGITWLDVTNLNQMPSAPRPNHVAVDVELPVRDPGPLCTADDVAQMRAAHVSESAIATACKS